MSIKPCKPFVLLFFCFHICFGTTLFAQSTTLSQVIPPSPTSREYDKYINYPVTLYNGVPEISIPLYSLKVGSISIPVSLNYHASGIKYGQTSGEVGVGWVLEPGYRISRTINGRPDELFPKPEVGDLDESSFGSKQLRDTYLSQFIRKEEQDMPVPSQLSDGEYDLFTYSMPSQSGTFVIEDRQTKMVRQISHSNLAINYHQLSDKSINYFELKDGNGIKYTTGPVENNGNTGYVPIPPTAWVLANIDDPFGNYARFSYSSYQETPLVSPATLLAHSGSVGSNLVCPDNGFGRLSQNPPLPYLVQRISEIQTNESIVAFNRNATSGFLNYIEVKNKQNQTIRKIQFYYSSPGMHMFLDSIKIFGTDMVKSEVYKFHYYGKDNGNYDFIPDYWGYYKRKPSSGANFPDFGAFSYCNPSDGQLHDLYNDGLRGNDRKVEPLNDAVYFTLDKITYPTGGSTTYEYEPNRYLGFVQGLYTTKYAGIRVRKISSDDLVKGETLIKRYVYGNNENGLGKVHIDIANNQYYITERPGFICVDASGPYPFVIASKELLFSTEPNAEISSGGFIGAPVQYEKVVEYLEEPGGNPDKRDGKNEYVYEVPSEANWYHYSINIQYYGFLGVGPGSNSYCGSPTRDWTSVNFPNYYISKYQTWNTPVLKAKLIYKLDNSNYQLIQKDTFQYNVAREANLQGLKVRRFFSPGIGFTSNVDFYACGINSIFDFAKYDISAGNKVLSEKTTTTYSGTASIEQKTKYYYNADFQVSREESWNSDGSVTSITSKYPVDYGNITATDNVSAGVKKLQQAHVLNPWVEKIKERNVSSNKLVDAFFQVYKTDRPLADKLLKVESTTPLINFNQSANNNGAISIDPNYQPRVLFNIYDSRGNIQEQQKNNDVKEAYIWGYNQTYPIAHVINAEVKDVFHTSFEDSEGNSIDGDGKTGKKSRKSGYSKALTGLANGSYILSYWQKNGSTWALQKNGITVSGNAYSISLSGQVDEVRFYPSTAQMATYTYDPLIGSTSQCDANNRITYYEYDGFNRLTLIRDQDKNIVKRICYNYAGQAENCNYYYNVTKSGNFTKSNCGSGYTGSTVAYPVPAGKYSSSVSQAAADQLAQNDVNANGQAYADSVGTCTGSLQDIYGNNLTSMTFVASFKNTSTNIDYSFRIYSTQGHINVGQIPSGTYNLTIAPWSGPNLYEWWIDGVGYYAGYNTLTLNAVSISGSTTISIQDY